MSARKEVNRQVAVGSECCSGFRMLQWVQNAAVHLITGTKKHKCGFHGCCVMTCTGWLFPSGCSTSMPWLLSLCSVQVPSSKAPCWLMRASLQSFQPATSPFGQPSQTEYSAVLSQYFWHSGFLSHRPDSCNSLPDLLHDLEVESECLRRHLKRISLPDIRDMSALGVSVPGTNRYSFSNWFGALTTDLAT